MAMTRLFLRVGEESARLLRRVYPKVPKSLLLVPSLRHVSEFHVRNCS